MNIEKELELELSNDHHYKLLLGEIKDLHKRQAILETRIASYDKLRLSIEIQIAFKIRIFLLIKSEILSLILQK